MLPRDYHRFGHGKATGVKRFVRSRRHEMTFHEVVRYHAQRADSGAHEDILQALRCNGSQRRYSKNMWFWNTQSTDLALLQFSQLYAQLPGGFRNTFTLRP